MDFQQIRDFVNPAVAQATGIEPVENLSMPVPVAYVPVQLVIDGALSLTSENPVQNKVIAVAIQQLDGRITAIEGQFSEGVTEAVNNWLAAHPEATTTVQDGAITYAKLDANLKGEVDQISDLKSALDAISSDVGNAKIAIDTDGFIRLNNTTATVTSPEANANYKCTYLECAPGDKFRITGGSNGNAARLYGFVSADGVVLTPLAPNGTTADNLLLTAPEECKYFVINEFIVNNSVTCYRDDSIINRVSVIEGYVSENTTKILNVENVSNTTADIVNKLNSLDFTKEYNLIPIDGWADGEIRTDGSSIINGTRVYSDFIPIDSENGQYLKMILTYGKEYSKSTGTYTNPGGDPFIKNRYCFYNSEKQVVEVTTDSNAYKEIPTDAKYIRVTLNSIDNVASARLVYSNDINNIALRPLRQKKYKMRLNMPITGYEDFKMVCFGDSITHGLPMTPNSAYTENNSYSYVDYANEMLHSNLINVGFGGTRMASTGSGTGIDLFGFWSLCEKIVSDDTNKWDELDAYVQTAEGAGFAPHLATLKSIDWNTIEAISLLYGANDFNSEQPIYGSYDESVPNFKTYYDMACYYGLTLLLTKYRHLQILLITPFNRFNRNTGTDSSTVPNAIGKYMYDYADSLKSLIIPRFTCPILDWNKNCNINWYTQLYTNTDGTHPFAIDGLMRLGKQFASAIQLHLAHCRNNY